MDIAIHAKVQCVDGPCGETITLIVDRKARRVTHLVVEDETLPYQPYQRMVPIEQVAEATGSLVRLDCTRADVARMEPFVETHYIQKTELSYSGWQGGAGGPPDASTVGASYSTFDEEKIPEGAVAIKPGTAVAATDGRAGTVGDLMIDPASGVVTHFGLLTGPKGQAQISLPLAAIERASEDTIYLKLSKQEIAQLPAIPVKRYHVAGEQEPTIDLVAVAFDAPEHASHALTVVERGQKQGAFKVLNAAVLVKDGAGNVTIKDVRDIDPKKGRRLGAVTGALIGLVGGPAGLVVATLAGAGVGGLAGAKVDLGFSDEFLNGLEQYLKPDTSALILTIEHGHYKQLSEIIAEEEGVFFRQTLTDKLVERFLAAGEDETGSPS